MFSRKGLIVIERTEEIDEEKLMETALEAGMEDLITYDDSYEVLTGTEEFEEVKQALVSAGYEFIEADIEYLPSMEAEPKDEKDIKNLRKMIDMLEDNDDVQKVYHNSSVELV